jgi:hypothetical protein
MSYEEEGAVEVCCSAPSISPHPPFMSYEEEDAYHMRRRKHVI